MRKKRGRKARPTKTRRQKVPRLRQERPFEAKLPPKRTYSQLEWAVGRALARAVDESLERVDIWLRHNKKLTDALKKEGYVVKPK